MVGRLVLGKVSISNEQTAIDLAVIINCCTAQSTISLRKLYQYLMISQVDIMSWSHRAGVYSITSVFTTTND